MGREKKAFSLALVGAAIAVCLLGPTQSFADDVERARSDAGLGLATLVANVFYVPVKVTYAAVGSVTGGLAYALTGGNSQAAERIWVPSIGGDYVLNRDQVSGDQRISFIGETDPDL